MHIAVYDDNIADRKQMERLLGRESEARKKEGQEGFYIDSYGNIPALLQVPQMYDGIFVDMTNGPENGLDVGYMLREVGVVAPIILCSSKFKYEEMIDIMKKDDFWYINKPILKAELHAMLDQILIQKGDPIPTIEIRTDEYTIYAKDDDVVYGKMEGSKLLIKLQDGRKALIISDIYNFYDECSEFPQICPISENALVNVNHVVSTGLTHCTMDDGTKLRISFSYRKNIAAARAICEDLKNKNS
ncbi:MAG: hypothetical protein K6B41_05565 [Butyrivibrio sp.]|nr:hypothetical protein [Butyrivibrio sp.]